METSFDEQKYITVTCCKCYEPLNSPSEDLYLCFLDKEEAVSSCEMYRWRVNGELATCPNCIEKENQERHQEYLRQKDQPYH